jgi:hypothetical protein
MQHVSISRTNGHPYTEVFQIVERKVVSEQVKKSILEHASVAVPEGMIGQKIRCVTSVVRRWVGQVQVATAGR